MSKLNIKKTLLVKLFLIYHRFVKTVGHPNILAMFERKWNGVCGIIRNLREDYSWENLYVKNLATVSLQ